MYLVGAVYMHNLLSRYDALIIDLWGVVHDGVHAYPGVVQTLNTLIDQKKVLFLSNAPRPVEVAIKKLIELGLHVSPKHLLTSGDAVREQLINWDDPVFRQLGKCFYHLGAARNQDILSGLQANVTMDIEKADFILLSAFMEGDEDLNQYDDLLKIALQAKLTVICANPDKIVVHGDSVRYCAGVLAEKYEKMGGTVFYYGKPCPGVYDIAFKRLQAEGVADKKRILMIGDTLETDILGANNVGIDSALVQTGNMERLLIAGNSMQQIVQNYGIIPTWIIDSLALEKVDYYG
jgi:HAD superfamily hydrolase (TIGR01459 family)